MSVMEHRALAVLTRLHEDEIYGRNLTIGDFANLKTLNGESEDGFRKALMKLLLYKCVEIQPTPKNPNEIQDSHSIKITDLGRGALSKPYNGNYWYPNPAEASAVNSTINVQAHNVQVGDNNTMTVQVQEIESIVSELNRSNLPEESKKGILKSIWKLVGPALQGTASSTPATPTSVGQRRE